MEFIEIENVTEIVDGYRHVTLRLRHGDAVYYLTIRLSPKREVALLSETVFAWNAERKGYESLELSGDKKTEISEYLTLKFEDMPLEKTAYEIREEFLTYVRGMVKYWSAVKGMGEEEKLEGVAFSILSGLDGSAGDMPGFIVTPSVNKADKDYCIGNGEDYYPYTDPQMIKSDIGGALHEYYKK